LKDLFLNKMSVNSRCRSRKAAFINMNTITQTTFKFAYKGIKENNT